MNPDTPQKSGKKISRKTALKKAGKYAMFTAAAAILIISPAKAAGISPPNQQRW